MDIGLHLLGSIHAFWEQPHEAQVDLLAYRAVMADAESAHRWGSVGPARLSDLAAFGSRTGLLDVIAGMRAWLASRGVRFKGKQDRGIEARAERALHMANAKRTGASKTAVSFWLGDT